MFLVWVFLRMNSFVKEGNPRILLHRGIGWSCMYHSCYSLVKHKAQVTSSLETWINEVTDSSNVQ